MSMPLCNKTSVGLCLCSVCSVCLWVCVVSWGWWWASVSSCSSDVVREHRPVLVPSAFSLMTEKCGLTQQSFTKPSWQALLCKHITDLFLSLHYRNNPPENTLILSVKQLLALYRTFWGPFCCLIVLFIAAVNREWINMCVSNLLA